MSERDDAHAADADADAEEDGDDDPPFDVVQAVSDFVDTVIEEVDARSPDTDEE